MEPKGSLFHYAQESTTCARSNQSMPPSHFWSIVILQPHLHLGLSKDLFPSSLPTKTLSAPLLVPICATWTTHLFLLNFITQRIVRSIDQKPSYVELSTPVTSPLLGWHILLSTLFSNTLSLHSCPIVSNQVPQPYETKGKIIVPYILIFIFFDSRLEDKRFCTTW